MHSDFLYRFLLWSMACNYLVLIAWFLVFTRAHHWLLGLHGKWFRLSNDTFDAIHYGGMAAYKIGILLFNVVPLVALYLARSGG